MKYKIINNSSWNEDFLKFCINFIIKDIKNLLPTFSIEFSDFCFNEDKNGNREFSKEKTWDGTSWEDGRIWVILHPEIQFPQVWWINEEFKEKYLRGIYLKDATEFFVFMVSHEIMHQVFYKNPKFKLCHKILKFDEESECDIFAFSKLLDWRKKYG